MNIYLSEMQEKEIISIKTGLNYGHIVDVLLDSNGNIIEFKSHSKKLFKKGFKNEEVTFKYEDIEKIGHDVILVRV